MLTFVRWVCLNRLKLWSECLLIICKIELFWLAFDPTVFLLLFINFFFWNNKWTCLCVFHYLLQQPQQKHKKQFHFCWHFTNLQNTLLFILELKSAFAFWWQLTFHLCVCVCVYCHLTLNVWWELRKMWSICTHFSLLIFFILRLSFVVVDCCSCCCWYRRWWKADLFLFLLSLLLYAFDVYVNDKKSLLGVNFKAICCVIYLFVLFTFRFDMHLLLHVTISFEV